MRDAAGVILFAPGASRGLGEEVAALLGVSLAQVDVTDFDDGERRTRPVADVAGRDVVVVQSLLAGPDGSVHDQLCQLLFLLGTLRDQAATSVTAVVPLLCYSRQDRPVHPRDPVTTAHVARLFEAVGLDRIITVDVHNPAAFANAYRIPATNLDTDGLLASAVADDLAEEPIVVVAPDAGGVKRAQKLQGELSRRTGRDVARAFVEKQRLDHVAPDSAVVGGVAGRTALIVDDMIGTGTTLVRAAQSCLEHGASRVVALATHGVFSGQAEATLAADRSLDRLVVTDTVLPLRLTDPAIVTRTQLRSVAALLAAAIDESGRAAARRPSRP